ncbi:NAD(P)H-dependent oxidoreductase subunit E [Sphaerisporangium sp. TRM90804]|uniref:NAD(P)H-dependent oxidoreductase subunit E n=1 Tax=Sphaerisporangium sp. TRM90804 TaxID=3031113 RepID=UPI00244AC3E3|nr:NAD(P)H-dependent oxidoreductase subunit E [Sphaerisporangium sp. TRM90804]MDH2428152.1 NAD(P)H-dependent oxidoreductase subunit E [Sphaerisporangium sp. TRM90804]
MDLRFRDAEPLAEERAAVDALLGPPPSSWAGGQRTDEDLRFAAGGHQAREQRDLLLPALHAVNDRVGWISEGALDYICRRLTIPPAEAYGVAGFYALFSLKPRPTRVLHVCTDLACHANGAEDVRRRVQERLGPPGASWSPSPCLGLCERAPAAVALEAGEHPRAVVYAPVRADEAELDPASPVSPAPPPASPAAGGPLAPAPPLPPMPSASTRDAGPGGTLQADTTSELRTANGVRTPDGVREAHGPVFGAGAHGPALGERGNDGLAELPEPPVRAAVPQAGDPSLVLLRRVGAVDPESLDDYRATGGYSALRRAFQLGPLGVIQEVTEAGLVGRGGAAFPAGRKWAAVAGQPDRPHYLVCNADESEPGTFKDRVLMEGDPYAVIEAMTIAAYATGCTHGYLYIRGEYPRAIGLLENAIATARARGLLGEDILGQGLAFDIEIRRGAGAYICGEETAIFNSIEGYRGEPRSKPPYPVEKGLFGKPTLVNNVETLVNVPPILLHGGAAYAQVGTEVSTGTKLFCVSGNVAAPGVYEVPFGATLRELLTLAGGVPGNLRAVLLGGAAGAFVRPDELDVPLTFEGTRAAGTTLGSGVVLVLDDGVDMARILLRIAEFFRDESCGQCVPCRVGTVRQEEALHRLSTRPRADDLVLLREVGQAMRDASICGLGQTAWNAVESAIDRLSVFPAAGTLTQETP